MTKRAFRQDQRIQPIGTAGIDACRKIVADKQAAKVNEVLVDLFSASIIVQVFDAINDANRAKLATMPVAKVASVCLKLAA